LETQAPRRDALDEIADVIRGERARLAAIARREGLDPEEAVDCVQEIFTNLLMRARQVPLAKGDRLRAELGATVKNAARNRRRLHRRAKPHLPIEEVEPEANQIGADGLVERAEEHVRLSACIAQLCDTQRAVVTLRVLDEQPGEDVATALGITRGHVDVLLHRAKANLRSCLEA